ncbi:class I SAM-dependent methyltransferase [Nocardioides sp. BP30]|uniref:class I SAM-dependent methyltransferase n=1 Tax=Nocardioides sp. BP30 TaxID=3036374 RepID=UPI002469832A|nr:class I SAM-dependent methyltransferase [Nocardioides sp. BP30]WGL53690.1 class I SAM-dependent methyltransferase [Nocardioides sp. BP30]
MRPSKRYPNKNGPFSSHAQVPALVGDGPGTLLDVGCAQGDMLALMAARGWQAVGIEPDPVDAAEAHRRGLEVIVGTVEEARDQIDRAFDVIVAADVIEHMADPGAALDHLRSILAPGGRLVLSVPNIAFLSVRLGLLAGSFTYQDRGPLDRTHLRFFTRSTIQELVRQHGFEITQVGVTPAPIEIVEQVSSLRVPRLLHRVNMFFARLLPRLFGYQTLVVATPAQR